jgi:glycosyltransferase involved in cell wall biosynthesis
MRLRRHFHFDLIDAHFGFPTGIAAAMIARHLGVPFIVTLRGNETMHAQSAPVRNLMKWTLQRASRIIVVSERLRTFALSFGIPQDRVKTIPNGIDSSVFYPRDRTASRRELSIAEQTKVILSVGALIERKGHHHLLRAAAPLLREDPDLLVLIAGGPGPEGDYENHLRAIVTELRIEKAVRFTGAVSSGAIAQLMCAADVFCLASSREGWPNVVHEAMACGTPVVANNVGAIPEMIASPERGAIVPPGDSLALERTLRCALSKSWDRSAISAWAQSRSWDTVGAEVYKEIEHVVYISRGGPK